MVFGGVYFVVEDGGRGGKYKRYGLLSEVLCNGVRDWGEGFGV